MRTQGKSLTDIRAFIDGKWSSRGPSTHTPLPPAGA